MGLSKKAVAISIIVIFGVTVFSILLFLPHSSLVPRDHPTANVLILSKKDESSLITSLEIDKAIDLTIVSENATEEFSEELLQFSDVIVIDRYLPLEATDLALLVRYVDGTKAEKGLIFFGALNNDDQQEDDFTDAQITSIAPLLPIQFDPDYKSSTSETSEGDYKIQVAMNSEIEQEKAQDKANSNVLVRDIAWTSSPLLSKRMIVEKKPGATQIIESIDGTHAILSEWDLSAQTQAGGRVIVYSAVITGYNNPFVLWPYFNYLMYVSVFHVHPDFADSSLNSYAEWPYSPIPHGIEIALWFSMIGMIWIITIYLYLKMRKKARQMKAEGINYDKKPEIEETTKRTASDA